MCNSLEERSTLWSLRTAPPIPFDLPTSSEILIHRLCTAEIHGDRSHVKTVFVFSENVPIILLRENLPTYYMIYEIGKHFVLFLGGFFVFLFSVRSFMRHGFHSSMIVSFVLANKSEKNY